MQHRRQLFCATAAFTAVFAAGCGGDKPGGSEQTGSPSKAAGTGGPLQADVVPPSSENALKIAVTSAVLGAYGSNTLVLAGTYTATRTTRWDQTSVDATAQGSTCTVSASPGFPPAAARPGSTVNGTWKLRCPAGSVEVVVDPFGGLLDSDTRTRITLH